MAKIKGNYILFTLFIAILYALAGKLGFEFAIPPGNISAVWPASGLAVGLLLFSNWKNCSLGIFLGSFIVNLFEFNLMPGEHKIGLIIISSTTIALGSLLQGVVIAYFIKKLIGTSYNHLFDVFKFSLISTCGGLVAATIGVTSLAACKFLPWINYSYTWITWFLGDLVGILLIVPLFMTWKLRSLREWELSKFLEYTLLFCTVFLVSEIIFSIDDVLAYALLFSISPIFIWAALRFSQFEVSLAFFITAAVAVVHTSRGLGIFSQFNSNINLIMLQAYITIIGLTKLTISTSIIEMKNAKNKIQDAYNQVDIQVKERTKELEDINNKLKEKIQEQENDRQKLAKINIENERLKELTKMLDKKG
jgi:integral membrane sensor domain MASE1